MVDASSWPRCDRFDGGSQPCWCWFDEQLEEIAPRNWPGGEAVQIVDYMNVTMQHECNAPWRPSLAAEEN
ncbi:hypothetical protein ABQE58_25105 [Mycolicibacterium elephantis]